MKEIETERKEERKNERKPYRKDIYTERKEYRNTCIQKEAGTNERTNESNKQRKDERADGGQNDRKK